MIDSVTIGVVIGFADVCHRAGGGGYILDLGGIATIAIGRPNRPSRVWFNLFRSTLIASGSANSLMVATISLSIH